MKFPRLIAKMGKIEPTPLSLYPSLNRLSFKILKQHPKPSLKILKLKRKNSTPSNTQPLLKLFRDTTDSKLGVSRQRFKF